MVKERYAWLDYVRFFSIFLVIVFHTPPRLATLDDAVILNLRVPVFFCVSGLLYSIDRWSVFWAYARHRAKQILVPYTTFFIIFYALWLVMGRAMVGPGEEAIPVLQPLWEFVLGNPNVVLKPFWYIACLFTMQMLYYGIERLVGRRHVWAFAVSCVLAAGTYVVSEVWESWPWVHYVNDFWNLGNACLFLPFYALGNCFKTQLHAMSFKNARTTVGMLLLAAASMAFMVLIAGLRDTTSPMGDPGLYNVLRDVAGMLVIPAYMCTAKWVASKLGRRHVVEFVVVSGTVYLGVQNYLIGLCKVALTRFCYPTVIDDHIWLKLVIALVVMAAIYPVAVFIDRRCPWLIGKDHPYGR